MYDPTFTLDFYLYKHNLSVMGCHEHEAIVPKLSIPLTKLGENFLNNSGVLADSMRTNLTFVWRFLQYFVAGENQIWSFQSAFKNKKIIFFAIQKMMSNSHAFSDVVFIESARIPEEFEKFSLVFNKLQNIHLVLFTLFEAS